MSVLVAPATAHHFAVGDQRREDAVLGLQLPDGSALGIDPAQQAAVPDGLIFVTTEDGKLMCFE